MAGEPMSEETKDGRIVILAVVASAAVSLFTICGVFQFARMVWAAVVN